MPPLKLKVILLTTLCFFLWQTSFAQSQNFFKLIYWNGEDMEMLYAKLDTDNDKGENLSLMIDQVGNNVTLWRNGKMLQFTQKK